MDESRLELKVGALLLSALAATLGLLWLMGEISFGGGQAVRVNFSHTGNVVKGAPVKFGGIIVGKVEKVELLPLRRDAEGAPLPVQMTLSVSEEALKALRSDAVVTVSSQGPLGEPYFELGSGSAKDPLNPQTAIRGIDAPRIDVVSNKLARFLESAGKMLESDPDSFAHFFSGISGLTRTVDGVLVENREQIREIAQEVSAAAKDLRVISATARTQLEPGGKANGLLDDASATAKVLRADVPQLSKNAQTALAGVAALSGGFTEDDGKKLKEAISKYSAAGEKLDAIATRADRILGKLEAGEGTLGATLKDKQVYDDLKSLLADLRQHPWKMLWKD